MKKSKLRVVMLSGDWIPVSMPGRIKTCFKDAQVFSLGGATEASIWSIYHPITEIDNKWKSIPYGKPLANQKFYVINSELELCPVEVKGELYIGGAGVAEGYMNDKRKTEESFIHHPELGYLYKTGDYGILHKDGNIEFLGRKDQQVKIRGYRVEMGEIENCLLKYPSVTHAVVVDRIDPNNRKYLCAYLITATQPDISELRDFLAEKLPDYMIPAYFVYLDKLPLTQNGKIDRKKLPEPDLNMEARKELTEAESDVEQWLVSVWKELLNIEKVGTEDNFFELGGDSLFAGQLIMKIQQEFNVEIPIDLMFEEPTIKRLAIYIMDNRSETNLNRSENLVLIRKGTEKNKNIFFIHAGLGEVDVYRDLCRHSNKDFSFWGVQLEHRDTISPYNTTIEETAERYIAYLKTVQPEGPYALGGWCAGGTIAFEMARIMEAKNEEIRFLSLFNSLSPQPGLVDTRPFSIETEFGMLKEIMSEKNIQEFENSLISDTVVDIEEFWVKFLDYMDKMQVSVELIRQAMPRNIVELIPNFEQLDIKGIFRALNLFRSSQRARALYFPSTKLKAEVFFFEATLTKFQNRNNWNLYCCQPIQIFDVEGSHVSIFFPPFVEKFADIFNLSIK